MSSQRIATIQIGICPGQDAGDVFMYEHLGNFITKAQRTVEDLEAKIDNLYNFSRRTGRKPSDALIEELTEALKEAHYDCEALKRSLDIVSRKLSTQ
jgi:hypothetical protein